MPHADPPPTVWPILHSRDTNTAVPFLVRAFGFREAIAVTDDDGDIVHAELRWPEGGAVVIGSTKHAGGVHGGMRPGSSASYVVADDVDAVYRTAVAAGAEILQAPHETQFGSRVRMRALTARDPEGYLWTFGTYRSASMSSVLDP